MSWFRKELKTEGWKDYAVGVRLFFETLDKKRWGKREVIQALDEVERAFVHRRVSAKVTDWLSGLLLTYQIKLQKPMPEPAEPDREPAEVNLDLPLRQRQQQGG